MKKDFKEEERSTVTHAVIGQVKWGTFAKGGSCLSLSGSSPSLKYLKMILTCNFPDIFSNYFYII